MSEIVFNVPPIFKYLAGFILMYMYTNYCKLDERHVINISIVSIIIMLSLDIMTIQNYDQMILNYQTIKNISNNFT